MNISGQRVLTLELFIHTHWLLLMLYLATQKSIFDLMNIFLAKEYLILNFLYTLIDFLWCYIRQDSSPYWTFWTYFWQKSPKLWTFNTYWLSPDFSYTIEHISDPRITVHEISKHNPSSCLFYNSHTEVHIWPT